MNCSQNVSLKYRKQPYVKHTYSEFVVNCSQNVSLKYRKQQKKRKRHWQICCELLSKCIFEIPQTTKIGAVLQEGGCELLSKCIFEIPQTTAFFD